MLWYMYILQMRTAIRSLEIGISQQVPHCHYHNHRPPVITIATVKQCLFYGDAMQGPFHYLLSLCGLVATCGILVYLCLHCLFGACSKCHITGKLQSSQEHWFFSPTIFLTKTVENWPTSKNWNWLPLVPGGFPSPVPLISLPQDPTACIRPAQEDLSRGDLAGHRAASCPHMCKALSSQGLMWKHCQALHGKRQALSG